MPHLIEVAFKGNRKEFFLWEVDELPPLRTALIVEADRGEDLGRVHAIGELAEKRSAGVPHGLAVEGAAPARRALRVATDDDVKRSAELAEQNESARRRAMERVKANGLVMKLTDAEWQWDRKKLTFYFTAEKRVDFRNLVRDLASMFRTRIELKQIGVRDEARRLDGIGRCGRQYCSASWLPELRPVNLGVAKDQRLSLNPTQISGACGRLMCCLRYEHEFYVQSRKRFPKEGKILVTSLGEEKVVANDIFNDRVTLRRPDGDARVVPLADLKREIAAAAASAGGGEGEAGTDAVAALGADTGDDGSARESSVDDDSASDFDDERTSASGGAAPESATGERRHEPARRGGRPAERRPRGSNSTNGVAASAAAAAPGATDSPASSPAASSAPATAGSASWLRQRSPLPQVAPPPVVAPSAPAVADDAAPIAPATTTPAGDATETASAASAGEVADAPAPEGGASAASEETERRARRRRGRRGGRRGRGGADRAAGNVNESGTATGAADGDDAPGDDTTGDDGGDDTSSDDTHHHRSTDDGE